MTATPAEHESAREFIADHASLDTSDLLTALEAAYADGIITGGASAADAGRLPVLESLEQLVANGPEHQVDWTQFWDTWQPGDADAARLLADGGWSQLLERAQVTVKGVGQTLLDQMGTVLADGVQAGESVDTIAGTLTSLLSDPKRAFRIADTEVNRAVTAASVQTYTQNGVGQYEILVSPDACDECEDLADGNPYEVGDDDAQPPIHPNCRCAVSPIVNGQATDPDGGD